MPKAEPVVQTWELAPGVFVISHLVDLAPGRTWVDPTATGFDPSNSYVILDGEEALLIETGFRAHGESLVNRLRELVPEGMPLHVVTTRIEPDCLGNLDKIVDAFRVTRILGQTNVKPLDYLGPLSHLHPELEFENGLRPGDEFTFGNGRTIVVVEPAVRTLPTMWLWDAASGALFTSDSFGGRYVERPDGPWSAPDVEDFDRASRHVLAKFDWLAIADTTLALQRLDRAAALTPLTLLAPDHGLWTVGAETLRARFELFRRVLRTAPRELPAVA